MTGSEYELAAAITRRVFEFPVSHTTDKTHYYRKYIRYYEFNVMICHLVGRAAERLPWRYQHQSAAILLERLDQQRPAPSAACFSLHHIQ